MGSGSDGKIVTTTGDTYAIVNRGASSINDVRIGYYNQDGLTLPSGLVVPEVVVRHPYSVQTYTHTAVTGGANVGDMFLVTQGFNKNIHIGRYKATSPVASTIVWQRTFTEPVFSPLPLSYLDYNPTSQKLAMLAPGPPGQSGGLAIWRINADGTGLKRILINLGNFGLIGRGIVVDDAGAVYVLYTSIGDVLRVTKITSSNTVAWSKVLLPSTIPPSGVTCCDTNFENGLARAGDKVYALGNYHVTSGSGQIYGLDQATGAAVLHVGLGGARLNGLVTAVPASAILNFNGVYFYGVSIFSPFPAVAGLIDNVGPTVTWYNRYPSVTGGVGFEGLAQSNFQLIGLVGATGGDSKFLYAFANTGAVALFAGLTPQGDTVDISGTGASDTFTDITSRTTPGFFDCFHILGDSAFAGRTLAYSRCVR